MARKRNQPPPEGKTLGVEQMEVALHRLGKRLTDLNEFDHTQVVGRNDPTITVLENAIDEFLTKTFGKATDDYRRYAPATNLNTSGLYFDRPTPLNEVVAGLGRGKERAIAILEGIRSYFLEEIEIASCSTSDEPIQDSPANLNSREIFVVHGRDYGTRDNVARFLAQLDLVPIILDEQSSKGRTIHQKFRDHTTVAYAVVLFTPDDLGGPAD